MIGKYLKLFGLTHDASLNDIKKAYRKLVKQNHPDRFIDEDQKKEHEKIMAKTNEAYKIIVKNFKNNNINLNQPDKKTEKENDYTLYKKGVDCYNIYFNSFFQLFSKRIVKTMNEKETILKKAESYFKKLLHEYPDSDWVFDSKEKLIRIKKTIETLNKV